MFAIDNINNNAFFFLLKLLVYENNVWFLK